MPSVKRKNLNTWLFLLSCRAPAVPGEGTFLFLSRSSGLWQVPEHCSSWFCQSFLSLLEEFPRCIFHSWLRALGEHKHFWQNGASLEKALGNFRVPLNTENPQHPSPSTDFSPWSQHNSFQNSSLSRESAPLSLLHQSADKNNLEISNLFNTGLCALCWILLPLEKKADPLELLMSWFLILIFAFFIIIFALTH